MNNDFLKFTRIYGWGWMLLGILGAALFITFIVFAVCGADVEYAGGLTVFPAMVLISLIPAFKQKRFRNGLSDIMPEVQQDFAGAVSFRKGKLRMGNRWIYVKGKSRLLNYGNIVQVYQRVTRTYFIESERNLLCVDARGRKHKLCYLELRGKSDEEVMQIVSFILRHNPNVKVGYNK